MSVIAVSCAGSVAAAFASAASSARAASSLGRVSMAWYAHVAVATEVSSLRFASPNRAVASVHG